MLEPLAKGLHNDEPACAVGEKGTNMAPGLVRSLPEPREWTSRPGTEDKIAVTQIGCGADADLSCGMGGWPLAHRSIVDGSRDRGNHPDTSSTFVS